MSNLRPEHPHEEGLPTREPPTDRQEAAHVLANDARPLLRDRGFDDEQIDDWARSYVEVEGEGTVGAFLAWVAEQERSG